MLEREPRLWLIKNPKFPPPPSSKYFWTSLVWIEWCRIPRFSREFKIFQSVVMLYNLQVAVLFYNLTVETITNLGNGFAITFYKNPLMVLFYARGGGCTLILGHRREVSLWWPPFLRFSIPILYLMIWLTPSFCFRFVSITFSSWDTWT